MESYLKLLRCNRVYDKCQLEEIVIEQLHLYVRYSMLLFWGTKRDATLFDLARHMTYLASLHHWF